tara:strand:- start:130 stop:798 length:669 start_codon:yes stop_codon:yes gene_type:complete
LAKRLSEKNKAEIIKLFIDGKTIENIAIEFNCTKLTISRNLKKEIGERKFKELTKSAKTLNLDSDNKQKITSNIDKKNLKKNTNKQQSEFGIDENKELIKMNEFMEITPLDCLIDNAAQKDLSSVPISEIGFPKIVYMIVDKKIELVIKYLREFPSWEFLSEEELNRKTIQIYNELKNAKRFCTKDQKVIKVPNTEVFELVAPLLLSRGISRIVNEDKLIAL